jgi:hypothetical protein
MMSNQQGCNHASGEGSDTKRACQSGLDLPAKPLRWELGPGSPVLPAPGCAAAESPPAWGLQIPGGRHGHELAVSARWEVVCCDHLENGDHEVMKEALFRWRLVLSPPLHDAVA